VYLFYRSARFGAGDIREQLAWATTMTEKVNQISESPVNLWMSVLSPGVNTLVWTTAVEHMHTLEASFDKLLADNGYCDLLAQAAKWQTPEPIVDGLMQYLTPVAEPQTPPAYATVVTATVAPGSFARGIEVGLELAQRAQQATGIATFFATSCTGTYGEVAWLADYTSIEQVEEGQQKLMADASFAAYLDATAKDAFLPGSSTQILYRRLV
jgi:hypothetical protein